LREEGSWQQEQTNNKEKASRQTHTRKKQQQLTKKKRTGKHKWKCAVCDQVQKKKKQAKQIPSGI
jgi:hypothetical protein